ncbi:hypothetical protein GH714_002377 [Hevea brasiliensis]|uniref:F-box domain-containing protein n=1 Tax=Hevea brasiliensis TaxID=3981 RepID=A0A6A6KZJ4_HEVBR|nr:hypothetical protein GH714_002377 [Hevea brasiliensis]
MSDHLPQELLAEVLSRLPVKSLLKCRCVSKTWYSLIADPSFIAQHLKKTAARNSGLLFFSYSTRELVWPFKENVRYLLYPDESFPANPVEELDCPFKGIKRFVNIVGSCNGVFCLSDDVYGKYAEKAFLWNPSVRKIVNIPCPNFTFTSYGPYIPHLGLALIPLLMIISLCADVIVSFSLGEEVFGEMEVPDCLVKKYHYMDVAVFDGSLLLVASFKLTGEGCFTVWMMKEYGIPGSWTKLFNISHLKWIRKRIFDTKIWGNAHSFYLDTFVESLVLLDETNEFTEVEASEDNSTNEILEDVASSSNSQLVIDEAMKQMVSCASFDQK